MSFLLTLSVFVTWVALSVGFCAIGVLVLRALTGLTPSWRNAYLAVWAGFGLLMAGLLAWHFLLPVDARALYLFILLATVSLIIERRWFASILSSGGLSVWFAVAIGAFAFWAANHALAPAGMDDYNYEFQAVRWFHDYRIVPGLANLHGRIGFNNSHHLFAAMLSWGPWSGAVNHIFNGLFVVLAFALMMSKVRELALGRRTASALVGALLMSPCVGLVLFGIFGSSISTLKADVFLCAATATTAVLFVEFASTQTGDERYLPLGATMLLLSAVLFSVKMSAALLCEVIAVAVVIRFLATVGWTHRVTVCGTLMAALIFCSVLARGVILSGYPLYPFTTLGMKVDWRVPVAQANAERAFITSCAQLRPTYETPVTGWTWVPTWARSTVLTDKFNIVLPLTLVLSCIPRLGLRSRGNQKQYFPTWAWATLAATSIVALAVWFVQAPAGRFAFIYFWIVFVVVLTVASKRGTQTPRWALAASEGIIVSVIAYILVFVAGIPLEFRAGMLLMVAFAFLWVNTFSWAIAKQRSPLVAALCIALGLYQTVERIPADLVRHRFAQIKPMVWLQIARLPEFFERPTYVRRRTDQGFIVYETSAARYDTPLPNTRYFNPSLELRTPGDLSKGFRNRSPKNAQQYGYSLQVVVTSSDVKEIITQDSDSGKKTLASSVPLSTHQ